MKEFWVVYDYGMGGAWGLARARSEAELTGRFPELKVVSEKPRWITTQLEDKLRSSSSFVADDASTYPDWVRTLIEERHS